MFIPSVASSLWSSAPTALITPTPATAPVSTPSAQPSGSATTGATTPFQTLSPDLQSWLTQNQVAGGGHAHHHHPHGSGDAPASGQLNTAGSSDPLDSTTPATG